MAPTKQKPTGGTTLPKRDRDMLRRLEAAQGLNRLLPVSLHQVLGHTQAAPPDQSALKCAKRHLESLANRRLVRIMLVDKKHIQYALETDLEGQPGCTVMGAPFWASTRRTDAPEWAKELMAAELKKPTGILIWNTKSGSRTSGMAQTSKELRCYDSSTWVRGFIVTCTVGREAPIEAQKAVLLHEIAHHNAGLGHDHDAVFLEEAVRLYRKHGLLEWLHTHDRCYYACEKKAVAMAVGRAMKVEVTAQGPVQQVIL